jgi:hypothetical protein
VVVLNPTAKRALLGGMTLLAATVVVLGLFTVLRTNPFTPADDGCPTTATRNPKSKGPGCQEAVPQAPAIAFTGPAGLVDDPTTTGRITNRMLHTHAEIHRAFTKWPWSTTCWDAHAWNPTSDHPLGRACDFTAGRLGRFPTAEQRTTGWQLAHWAQINADTLGIRYIIWDGQIWSGSRFRAGWRPYNGAGIYDPKTPTGGHYDHVHISVVS